MERLMYQPTLPGLPKRKVLDYSEPQIDSEGRWWLRVTHIGMDGDLNDKRTRILIPVAHLYVEGEER